ncbi:MULTISPECIES: hypothetical protein [Legionella]|uniref:Uncharacterized protein n=1 Tax=Legionella drozanskii LLAP-1 TaxID=1212489 RepID=A0A0W0SXY0_9GAMM|nr:MULTISPECIES: hypothetical protein [Legionella]KTC88109.1 hypothetical protein Ldro_1728 [Legionella drozanskii LLAP-1]PJE08026.1 MAG: hypothetical protein CK430_12985 [Legionella sp.]
MQIQPLQPVAVRLKCGHAEASCFLVELRDTEMQLTSTDYLENNSPVVFSSKFFKGEAKITNLNFSHHHFNYTLAIVFIQFQPGLLVNKLL